MFPGDTNQITDQADAILFLSLISGNNPDYLIGKQTEAVSFLRNSNLEIIPTGYLLINNHNEFHGSDNRSTIEKVTKTEPLIENDKQQICDTAKAGEFLGLKLLYLEAGSGAGNPISIELIQAVKQDIKIPLLVGGGIKSKSQIEDAYHAGADMVVIGTALEEDETFFEQLNFDLSRTTYSYN